MPTRKKSTRRRRPSRRRQPSQPAPPREPLVNPETAQAITGVILLLLGIVLLLAEIGITGLFSKALYHGLRELVGLTVLVIPLALILVGWRLARKQAVRRQLWIGGLIIIASLSALFHIFVHQAEAAARAGHGGGLMGFALTS